MTALTHACFVENDLLRVTGGLFYLLGSLGYQAVLHRFVLGNTSLSCVSDPTAFVTIRVCMFRNIIPDSWVQCNVNWNRRSYDNRQRRVFVIYSFKSSLDSDIVHCLSVYKRCYNFM